jgi:hypothetical protein
MPLLLLLLLLQTCISLLTLTAHPHLLAPSDQACNTCSSNSSNNTQCMQVDQVYIQGRAVIVKRPVQLPADNRKVGTMRQSQVHMCCQM